MVAAAGVRAAGFARNRGAEAAVAEWLVFLDADTRGRPARTPTWRGGLPSAGAGATAVPFLLVYDAVECAAVAAGAIRTGVWSFSAGVFRAS
jgi:hypothetical protein